MATAISWECAVDGRLVDTHESDGRALARALRALDDAEDADPEDLVEVTVAVERPEGVLIVECTSGHWLASGLFGEDRDRALQVVTEPGAIGELVLLVGRQESPVPRRWLVDGVTARDELTRFARTGTVTTSRWREP